MKRLIVVVAALALTGCGIYKPYERPEINVAVDSLYGAEYACEDTASIADMGWKELFTDAHLQALIERALTENTDMRTAQLRVEQAEASLKSARLAYLPSFNFAPNGGVASFKGSPAAWSYTVPVSASWEIDILARTTNQKRQAKSLYEQSQDYRDAVQSGLVAAVASQYYTLLMLDRQIEILTATAATYGECVRVMDAMKSAGMTTEIGVEQLRAAHFAVQASVWDIRQAISEVENSLAATLAVTPSDIERGSLDEQSFPSTLNYGVPVQLLSRRPDVRAAEQSLAQAYYATAIARASMYPSLSLSGVVGWTNAAGSAVINPGGLLLNAAASILQPIFNARANATRAKIARSQQEAAMLSFRQTVLNAGSEVNNALTAYQTAQSKLALRQGQVASLRNAAEKTQILMTHSSTIYLDVLTAQQALLTAQMDEAADRFASISAVISLYHALGGGTK